MNSDQLKPTLSIAGTGGYASLGPNAEQKAGYDRIAAGETGRELVEKFTIPARTGKAFEVPARHVLRLACAHGPQVADMIVFNGEDTNEQFWSARTRVIHGGHLTTGHQLWSAPPYVRPLMTIIADTVDHDGLPHNAASHDLLFCRCDARHYEIVHGARDVPSCQENLASAIAPFGLDEYQVHDPFNVFMTTGLNPEGRPFYLPCVAERDDFVEFIAEVNCLVAISACPGGSSGDESRPLDVSIWKTGT